MKNKEKLKTKNRVAQKKRSSQKSAKSVLEEEVILWAVRFVKEVGFKPRVQEIEGVMNEQSGESKEEEVMGEGIGESEMEELVPE